MLMVLRTRWLPSKACEPVPDGRPVGLCLGGQLTSTVESAYGSWTVVFLRAAGAACRCAGRAGPARAPVRGQVPLPPTAGLPGPVRSRSEGWLASRLDWVASRAA